MRKTAALKGLRFEASRAVSNTYDILRTIQYASTTGRGWKHMKAVQGTAFNAEFDAFTRDWIVATAVWVGLDGAELRAVMQDPDLFAADVDEDCGAAVAFGAEGLPLTVLHGRIVIPGAARSPLKQKLTQTSRGRMSDVCQLLRDQPIPERGVVWVSIGV